MASPGEDPEQLERRLSDAPASDREVALEHQDFDDPQSNQALSTDDPPTTTEAVLRILTAVEHISAKMDQISSALPSDEGSDEGCISEKRSPTALSENQDRIATEEGLCCPDIERLPMSEWIPPLFLSERLRFKKKSVVAAFYTHVPKDIETAEECVSDADFRAAYSKDKWSSAPQRILIHCREVIDELRKITKVPDTQRTGVLAMVPPFKYLIYHRDAIKSKLDDLKKAASDREHAQSTTGDSVTDEDRRIHGLQCILDFTHTDLANYIGLELRARDGDVDEVLFEETYHLFKPGDLVLAAETGESLIYQVSSVIGGRMLLSSRFTGSGNDQHPRETPVRAGTWMDLRITHCNMVWDGENIGPRHFYSRIPYFTGKKWVTDLDVYPIQFHKHGNELRKRLCPRGLKYIQCKGHKRYTGASVKPHKSLTGFEKKRPETVRTAGGADILADDEDAKSSAFEMVRGDVYIDYKAMYTQSFSNTPLMSYMPTDVSENAEAIDTLSNGMQWNCSDRDIDALLSGTFLSTNRHITKYGEPKNDLADDETRLQMLPGQVPAFVFSTRRWEWLNIDSIEDIDKSETSRNSGWKELVIPDKFSELLLSLVSNHIPDIRIRQWETFSGKDSTNQIDLVRGKGRGLIILLHGPPGSGKTSTAETIAAYTGRPLYAITCGDLGTAPKELEHNLVRHTRLAQKWGCVLLLDEADVFLGSRSYNDMQRNAMVSVFLRQLEYYSGILFLTTNIVGVIDEAFKSRIHVALEYPAIDEESTLEIWSKMLQRIKRDNEKAETKILFDETALIKFAKKHYRSHRANGTTWNGRQIRNAFQTAIGIGQYKRLEKIDEAAAQGKVPEKRSQHIRLTVASFETVAETTSDFERYIRRTRGDDRERAAVHEFRRDEHSREPPPKKGYRTPVSVYQTDRDTGASRSGRSRHYGGPSPSPRPRRTGKGKEVHREGTRVTRSVSDSEEHTEQDSAKHQSSDAGSDEDIIEQDFEDEDE